MKSKFNKILIIENDNEQDAENDYEMDFADTFFKGLPIEYWYRFFMSFTYDNKGKDKGKAMKKIQAIPDTTLLVTYTTFCNSVMSGYGDVFGQWVRFFSELPNKVNFCVMAMPEMKYELLDWIGEGYGKTQAAKKVSLLKGVLSKHNFYSMPMSYKDEKPFELQATLLDASWLKENYIKEGTEIIYKRKKCTIGGFNKNSEKPHYTLWVPIGNGTSRTMDKITIEEIKKIKK